MRNVRGTVHTVVATAGIAIIWVTTEAPRAQTNSQPSLKAPSVSEQVLVQWNDIGRKLTAMAEDFPQEKYDDRATPDVRTFGAQLLHVAGTNYVLINALTGKKLGPAENDPSRDVYKTKSQIAALVKKSFEDGAALIRQDADNLARTIKDPDTGRVQSESVTWLGYAEHAGEHYGQLVLYYRLNKLVPPESRPRGR